MEIIEKFQDLAGKWRTKCLLTSGAIVMWKFSHEPTTQELEDLEAEYLVLHQYDDVMQVNISLYDHKELITEVLTEIKTHPSLTLAQWNTYLAGLEWYDASVIRWFVFRLAQGLAERFDIFIADYTEVEVLTKLRDWIVASPQAKIIKAVFGDI